MKSYINKHLDTEIRTAASAFATDTSSQRKAQLEKKYTELIRYIAITAGTTPTEIHGKDLKAFSQKHYKRFLQHAESSDLIKVNHSYISGALHKSIGYKVSCKEYNINPDKIQGEETIEIEIETLDTDIDKLLKEIDEINSKGLTNPGYHPSRDLFADALYNGKLNIRNAQKSIHLFMEKTEPQYMVDSRDYNYLALSDKVSRFCYVTDKGHQPIDLIDIHSGAIICFALYCLYLKVGKVSAKDVEELITDIYTNGIYEQISRRLEIDRPKAKQLVSAWIDSTRKELNQYYWLDSLYHYDYAKYQIIAHAMEAKKGKSKGGLTPIEQVRICAVSKYFRRNYYDFAMAVEQFEQGKNENRKVRTKKGEMVPKTTKLIFREYTKIERILMDHTAKMLAENGFENIVRIHDGLIGYVPKGLPQKLGREINEKTMDDTMKLILTRNLEYFEQGNAKIDANEEMIKAVNKRIEIASSEIPDVASRTQWWSREGGYRLRELARILRGESTKTHLSDKDVENLNGCLKYVHCPKYKSQDGIPVELKVSKRGQLYFFMRDGRLRYVENGNIQTPRGKFGEMTLDEQMDDFVAHLDPEEITGKRVNTL